MITFVLCLCAYMFVAVFVRFSFARYYFWFAAFAFALLFWVSMRATTRYLGVERVETQTESIRQDSTQTRSTFFGYYASRSHMGGGLMGGK
jgi:hypothetical protein